DIAMPVVYGDGKFAVFADRGQIEQLLINLVVNARDATGSGGTISVATMLVESEEPRIEGNALIPPGRYACLSVADSGSGMTDETIEHIFEPFYTTKSKGKGTGLGLSIVHSIVTKHKGWLSVTSAPGRGSEFRVYLPLYAGEMPERRSEVRQTVTLQGTETVLMVEDNSDVMKLHKEMLGRCGYTMLSASDGVEALELFSAHRDEIQIAVVDVIMPRMNGVELVGRIRQECPDLPIIMTSGYADEIIDRAAINELEVLFLHKPVKRLDLLIAIRSCLDT
ncbi:MAG: ATP-binding protein, partial [Desulfuromonadales bacterium]